ncbi:CD27 antigen [Latimeria chalumnae]|uniref:CD27 antigen n=1 Tax=Latimeria chalumnae TaxID=7897 RepID=UPI00313C9F8B
MHSGSWVTLIALTSFSILQDTTQIENCNRKTHYKWIHDTKCCKMCPPGFFMKSRCTATSDTHCEPCVTGEAFNTGWNTKFSCERCRLCVEVFRYMKNCTHDSDSECTCKPGLTCLDSECTRCGISTPASMSSHRDPRTTDQKLETTDPNSPSNISPEKGSLAEITFAFVLTAILLGLIIICMYVLHRNNVLYVQKKKKELLTDWPSPKEEEGPLPIQEEEKSHCQQVDF